MLRNDPPRHLAVLARVERIRPNDDGSGQMTYMGPLHLFNGDDYWNTPGRLKAWCGVKVAGVDLRAIEDREEIAGCFGALAADLCGRCFLLPSRSRRRNIKDGA